MTISEAITFDYDKWDKNNRISALEFYNRNGYDIPENLYYDLAYYHSKIKEHIDGYLLCPNGKFKGTPIGSKQRHCWGTRGVITLLKREKQNQNCLIFLYSLYENTPKHKLLIKYAIVPVV